MQRNFHDIDQNSDDWDELRKCRFTASGFKALFMGKTTAGYRDALYQPIFERLTGESPDHFYGEYMKRGHELEPYAIEQYEMDNFVEIQNGGFFSLGEWVGASPDGLIGNDGLFEGKAPKYTTHIDYLIKRELPKEYYWQVHGQMYVTDRDWVDFYSFHPGIQPLCLRVHREEKIENELKEKLKQSIEAACELLEKLTINEFKEAA